MSTIFVKHVSSVKRCNNT